MCRKLEVTAAHRGVEVVGLGLEPVVHAHRGHAPDVRRDVEDDGQVGKQAADRPVLQGCDLLAAELAPGALVGDRAVDIAVGDDHPARGESRPDQLVDVVSLVGGEQQRLGPRGHVLAVQDELADLGAEGRAARLAGDQDLAAALLEDGPQQAHLGRLARAVATLEADEEPGSGVDPASRCRKVLRHGPSLCDPTVTPPPPPTPPTPPPAAPGVPVSDARGAPRRSGPR